ncbi:MAG: FG-GAP repeat protein [Ignavibacteria bacterium]|nr:FG-GAP repeat protein [Ignavibacteria bacterium]
MISSGISVSTTRDVNGDGYSDVIAGANLNDAGGTDAGAAYIYIGGSVPDNTADLILTGVVAGDRLGVISINSRRCKWRRI